MANANKFWNKIAKKYSRQPIADEAAYQHKLEKTREYFSPTSKVLEFGCGTGSTAIAHAPYVGEITGIDFSQGMIDIAHERLAEAGVKNVTFECSDIESFDSAHSQYDVILGLSVLHLIPDYEQTISKVFQMVKPGGVFVSSTACIGDMAFYWRLLLPIGGAFGAIPKLNIFNKSALSDAITSAGFQVEYDWQPGKGKAVFIVARKPA